MGGGTRLGPFDSFSDSYSNSQDDPFAPDGNRASSKHHIMETGSNTHYASGQPSIGFQGYIVETSEPFQGFHHIVVAYCLMAFLLMYPFVVCGRHVRESRRRRQAAAVQQSAKLRQQQQDGVLTSPPGSEIMQTFTGRPKVASSAIRDNNSEVTGAGDTSDDNNSGSADHTATHTTTNTTSIVLPPQQQTAESTLSYSSVPRAQKEGDMPKHDPVAVTPTTTKSTLQDDYDDDPDKPLPDKVPVPPIGIAPPGLNHRQQQHPPSSSRGQQQHQQRQHSQAASSSGISAILSRNAASAATTGRLYSASGVTGRRAAPAAWPRHKHSRRPSGDPSWQWRRAIQTERRHRSRRMEQQQLSAGGLGLGGGGSGKANAAHPSSSNNVLFRLKSNAAGRAMSGMAGSVLDAEQQDQQHKHRQATAAAPGAAKKASSASHQQQSTQQKQQQMMMPRNSNRATMVNRQRQSSNKQSQLQPQHGATPQGRMMRRPSQSGSARSGRSGSLSVRSYDSRYGNGAYQSSVMSSIVDDILPNDAADADDPGKVRAFPTSAAVPAGAAKAPCGAVCCTAMEPWLDVAEPNEEWKRLLGLAIPMTLGSMVEPVSRCILVGILSQWVGTHAMVAYLLVNLLYRMTGEILSVAVTDAESALVQMALTSSAGNNANQGQDGNNNNGSNFTKDGYMLAGQYVQLACFLQVVLVGTVLLLWYFWIEDVIFWWVDSAEMASLGKDYFEIILVLFLAQAIYRALMVPCHMRGAAHTTLETAVDIFVTAATLITSVVVLSQTADVPSEHLLQQQQQQLDKNAYYNTYSPEERLADSRTALITVAWIQVNIGIAACVLKVAFCIIKGWLNHFWGGLIRSMAILNFGALCNLLLSSIPLILGSFLELGEVDLLTLFVQYLGPAEVAAWAVLGCIWDILEASTEGISEASAVRVAYHLSTSQPLMAKKVAHKALFWTVVGSLVLTSILLLSSRHLVVALTVDYTLQHLLNDLLGLVGLANLSMAFAQVCWSLVGAQGRFNLATLVVLVCRWLVTMPLALVFIFAMHYDEVTLAGAVAAGSATAAALLASILFSSDWNEVEQLLHAQGLLMADDDDDHDFSFGDDDESSSSDEDSFGVGGYPSIKKSLDDDERFDLPQSTEPTSRTVTSGVNSGASGIHSGADSGVISGVSGFSGS